MCDWLKNVVHLQTSPNSGGIHRSSFPNPCLAIDNNSLGMQTCSRFWEVGSFLSYVLNITVYTMMITRPRTMETTLRSRARRPSLRAPSVSPCCRLFLDWKHTYTHTGQRTWRKTTVEPTTLVMNIQKSTFEKPSFVSQPVASCC